MRIRTSVVVEDDVRGERLIALGSERSEPKQHCSSKLPRAGSGELLASGSLTFAPAK